ncbi:MAG: exo-alpha-sialidase, partial [Flavobacteriales bacterium]|nr:exo-alpha-sialidase [Flavobacteriales bacterium]
KGIFFDGFAFWDEKRAIAYSDPIDKKFFVIRTLNGKTWEPIPAAGFPEALEGEAGFAASGTGIQVMGDSTAWIATGGGASARVMKSVDLGKTWNVYATPLVSKEGAGIFSMVYISQQKGIVVGGSYLDSTNSTANCAVTKDGGLTWEEIRSNQPQGYRSCVAVTPDGDHVFAVGRTGSERSDDGGLTWKVIGTDGYYACASSKKYVWAVGRSRKIAKLTL